MTTRSPVTAAKPAPQRRALALVALLQQQREPEAAAAAPPGGRACRRVEPSSTTMSSLAQRHGHHAADDLLDRVALVVHRHHDRQQRDSRAPPSTTRPDRAHPAVAPEAARVRPAPPPGRVDDGVQLLEPRPSTRARDLIRSLEAYSTAGSPGRRGPSVVRHPPPRHALDGGDAPRGPSAAARCPGCTPPRPRPAPARPGPAGVPPPGPRRGCSRGGTCRPASGSPSPNTWSGCPAGRGLEARGDHVPLGVSGLRPARRRGRRPPR